MLSEFVSMNIYFLIKTQNMKMFIPVMGRQTKTSLLKIGEKNKKFFSHSLEMGLLGALPMYIKVTGSIF